MVRVLPIIAGQLLRSLPSAMSLESIDTHVRQHLCANGRPGLRWSYYQFSPGTIVTASLHSFDRPPHQQGATLQIDVLPAHCECLSTPEASHEADDIQSLKPVPLNLLQERTGLYFGQPLLCLLLDSNGFTPLRLVSPALDAGHRSRPSATLISLFGDC